jgi:hypothetical protein
MTLAGATDGVAVVDNTISRRTHEIANDVSA